MEKKEATAQLDETPLKNHIFFGLPRTSTSIVLGIIDFAIIFIYIEGYGLDPLFTGIAAMFGKFAIAISQFSMGWLSDKTKTKWGRRKPYMIIGAPLLSIAFILLLIPPIFLGSNPDMMTLFAWLLIFDMLFQFFYGELTTPYQSWMAEQFLVHERPKAAGYQNIFNYVGTAVALLFTMLILPDVLGSFETTKVLDSFFIILLIIFGLVTVALFYISAIVLPVETAPPVKMNLKKDLKEIVSDTNFMHVCIMVGIASLTWSMITGIMLGYVQFVLKLTSTLQTILAAVALAIGVILALFIWQKVIAKVGKKKALIYIFMWAIVTLPLGLVLPIIPFEDFLIPALILVVIVAAALGGWFLFPYILYADLAENNDKNTEGDELKAGLYTGFPSIILNLFQGFSLLLTGIILGLPNVSGETYSWGYLIWAPIGSAILIVALLYTIKFITLDFEWEKEGK